MNSTQWRGGKKKTTDEEKARRFKVLVCEEQSLGEIKNPEKSSQVKAGGESVPFEWEKQTKKQGEFKKDQNKKDG